MSYWFPLYHVQRNAVRNTWQQNNYIKGKYWILRLTLMWKWCTKHVIHTHEFTDEENGIAAWAGFWVKFIFLHHLHSERIWGGLSHQRRESSCLISPQDSCEILFLTKSIFIRSLNLLYNKTWILSSSLCTKKGVVEFLPGWQKWQQPISVSACMVWN